MDPKCKKRPGHESLDTLRVTSNVDVEMFEVKRILSHMHEL